MATTSGGRWTTRSLLMATAIVAANLSLFSQIVRAAAGHPAAWALAALMMAVNAILCLVLGLAAKLQARAMVLMFTVAALTETALWQRALARRDTSWVAPVAVAGIILLAALLAPARTPPPRG